MLDRYLIRERFFGPQKSTDNQIWLHGASLGECKVLGNVACRLQSDIPQATFLITTQKAEIVKTLSRMFNSKRINVSIAPAPFDFAVKKFIEQAKPKALVLCENELWPAYLKIANQNEINVALISGRFKNAAPWLNLNALKFVTFQTQGDKKRFESFCNAHAKKSRNELHESLKACEQYYGNWKLLLTKQATVNTAICDKQFDVAFLSIHFSEWNAIKKLVENCSKKGERILLAPRRLEECEYFENAVQNFGNTQITILKKLGVLQEFIPQCKAAVMGGSFTKRPGIHNFLEPLSFGVQTFVGPYATGEHDFVEELLLKKILTRIPNGTETLPTPLANSEQITKFVKEEIKNVERGYQALVQKLQEITL